MELEKITPEVARGYLENNIKNRSLNMGQVTRLAEIIKRGDWEINGETIKFDEHGMLVDGQHRLSAIVKSGLPVQTYVVRSLKRSVFDTIDTGKSRTGADILSIEGYKNCTHLSAAARLAYIADHYGTLERLNGRGVERSITPRNILDTVIKHPTLTHSTDYVRSKLSLMRMTTPSVISYCHFLITKIDPVKGAEFFDKLASGIDLSEDSPILVLRDRMYREIGKKRADRLEVAAFIIKTWNAFVVGNTFKMLKYDGQALPEIVNPKDAKRKSEAA